MDMAAEYWKPHDFRRTCATNLGDLGIPDEVVSLVLGHAKKDVTGRVYNLSQRLPEVAAALVKWAGHIERLLARLRTSPRSGPGRTAAPAAKTGGLPHMRSPARPKKLGVIECRR